MQDEAERGHGTARRRQERRLPRYRRLADQALQLPALRPDLQDRRGGHVHRLLPEPRVLRGRPDDRSAQGSLPGPVAYIRRGFPPGLGRLNPLLSESARKTQMTPNLLIAPDKFKGSLSADEVVESLAAGLRRGYGKSLDIDSCPIADGGDGTLDIAVSAGFRRTYVNVEGPTGEHILASYAQRGGVAFVELAEASGLRRLPGGALAPLAASTYGTGQLIADAISRENRTVVLAIGGSATSDGGAGLVQALGARLHDARGDLLGRGGG